MKTSDLKGHLTCDNTYGIGRPVNILLDGVMLKNVTEAHTEEGWAIRAVMDADGNFVLNEAGDEVLTERVTGKVEAVDVL